MQMKPFLKVKIGSVILAFSQNSVLLCAERLLLTHHHAELAPSLLNPCSMVNSTWFSSILL